MMLEPAHTKEKMRTCVFSTFSVLFSTYINGELRTWVFSTFRFVWGLGLKPISWGLKTRNAQVHLSVVPQSLWPKLRSDQISFSQSEIKSIRSEQIALTEGLTEGLTEYCLCSYRRSDRKYKWSDRIFCALTEGLPEGLTEGLTETDIFSVRPNLMSIYFKVWQKLHIFHFVIDPTHGKIDLRLVILTGSSLMTVSKCVWSIVFFRPQSYFVKTEGHAAQRLYMKICQYFLKT